MKPLKYWTPEEFEASSNYSLKIRANQTRAISKNGNLCTYTYNELGYRGDSIHKKGFTIMSIGCSFTEGVGVGDNETWPAQFSKLIPDGVNMNFGTGGRSNDFISRCLLSYYDLIKPDLVLIMYTNTARKEIYTKDNTIEPFRPTQSWGYMADTKDGKKISKYLIELQNDNEDFINWYKNHLLIKYFLESKKCNWLWNGSFGIPTEYEEFNRFDGGYRDFIDKGVDDSHPGPQHNYQYSKVLFNHIYNNFRSYLPNNIEPIENILI